MLNNSHIYFKNIARERVEVNVIKIYTIWYNLHSFKNLKNTYGGVLLLVNYRNSFPWEFSTILNCANSTKLLKASHTYIVHIFYRFEETVYYWKLLCNNWTHASFNNNEIYIARVYDIFNCGFKNLLK